MHIMTGHRTQSRIIRTKAQNPLAEFIMPKSTVREMMNPEISAKDWEYFDKIYCISVDQREDRRDAVRIQFDRVGVLDKVEFVIVKKHPHSFEQGIFESHMRCIKKGIEANANNIVIFEDDVQFERFSRSNLEHCIDFLSKNADWNALFFGCLVSGSKKTENKCVRKVKYRCLAHAYVLNRRFAEVLVNKPWQKIAFDSMLSFFKEGFYAIYPSFAFQSNSPTDNKSLHLDKFRRLCGGLRRIQKWNEAYYRHRRAFIGLHIMVILLIVIWIFR
jgi:GR25 family glycosyltransferase involved in LPS biosynthesis